MTEALPLKRVFVKALREISLNIPKPENAAKAKLISLKDCFENEAEFEAMYAYVQVDYLLQALAGDLCKAIPISSIALFLFEICKVALQEQFAGIIESIESGLENLLGDQWDEVHDAFHDKVANVE